MKIFLPNELSAEEEGALCDSVYGGMVLEDPSTWTCQVCGCWEEHACWPFCWWVRPGLCSQCACLIAMCMLLRVAGSKN